MPDSGIILQLCKLLIITINDLFSGELVDMKNYDESIEKKLIRYGKAKRG